MAQMPPSMKFYMYLMPSQLEGVDHVATFDVPLKVHTNEDGSLKIWLDTAELRAFLDAD